MRHMFLQAKGGKTSTTVLLGRNDFDCRPLAAAFAPDYKAKNSGLANHVPSLMFAIAKRMQSFKNPVHIIGPALASALYDGVFVQNQVGTGIPSTTGMYINRYTHCIAMSYKNGNWRMLGDDEATANMLNIHVLILWNSSDKYCFNAFTTKTKDGSTLKLPANPDIMISLTGLQFLMEHGFPGRTFFRLGLGESCNIPIMRLKYMPTAFSSATYTGELLLPPDTNIGQPDGVSPSVDAMFDSAPKESEGPKDMAALTSEPTSKGERYRTMTDATSKPMDFVVPAVIEGDAKRISIVYLPTGLFCALPLFKTQYGVVDSVMILTCLNLELCNTIGSFERGTNPGWILLQSMTNDSKMVVVGAPRGPSDPSYDGTIDYRGLTAGTLYFAKQKVPTKYADSLFANKQGIPYGFNLLYGETRDTSNRDVLTPICDGEYVYGISTREKLWRDELPLDKTGITLDGTADLFNYYLFQINESRDAEPLDKHPVLSDPDTLLQLKRTFTPGIKED